MARSSEQMAQPMEVEVSFNAKEAGKTLLTCVTSLGELRDAVLDTAPGCRVVITYNGKLVTPTIWQRVQQAAVAGGALPVMLQVEYTSSASQTGDPKPIPVSPSDFGKQPFLYDAGAHVAMQRPHVPPPTVLPPELMYEPYLRFRTDLGNVAGPSVKHEALVMKLVDVMSEYYQNEKKGDNPRVAAVRKVFQELMQLAELGDELTPVETGNTINDGCAAVLAQLLDIWCKYIVVEVKNELGTSGDASLQLAAYSEIEILRITMPQRRLLWPCPLVCLDASGSHLRVLGCMWAGPCSNFIVRAADLTSGLVPFQRLGRSHMNHLSRLVYALSRLLSIVKHHYNSVDYPLPDDLNFPAPWILLRLLKEKYIVNARLFAEVGERAMYLAERCDAAGTTVCIKLLEHDGPFFGAQVQALWSEVNGAAPRVHLHEDLGCGFHVVISDYKSPAEGWQTVSTVPKDERGAVQQAALTKLERVQEKHPFTVHGDARCNNALWRLADGKIDISFVDFDRSGMASRGVVGEGAHYPSFVSMAAYAHMPEQVVWSQERILPSHDHAMIMAWHLEA